MVSLFHYIVLKTIKSTSQLVSVLAYIFDRDLNFSRERKLTESEPAAQHQQTTTNKPSSSGYILLLVAPDHLHPFALLE
jgi:hypothetical protein